MSKLGSWLRDLKTVLRPSSKTCVQCNQPATSQSPELLGFCQTCAQRIPWIRQIHCPICGRYEACSDCLRRSDTRFVRNRSAVQYNSDMKDMLARYKYRGDEKLCETMSNMLCYAYVSLQSAEKQPSSSKKQVCRALTFVPLSEERLTERGFNQAELLARKLGDKVNLPVIDILQRTRHTEKQSFKTRNERLHDLENIFVMKNTIDNHLISADIQIYVVDDVYTTGSTLQQCASTITNSLPSAKVYGLTWAR